MESNACHRILLLMICSGLLLPAGCLNIGKQSPPTKFYVMTSMQNTAAQQQAGEDGGQPRIGIGPIRLPEILDRTQIVTRSGRNEIIINEFAKWAEPLEANFSRVLADNLSVLTSSHHVALFPWKPTIAVAYRIVMDVARFDGTPGENVILRARWTIFGQDGETILHKSQSVINEPVEENSIPALVQSHSRALETLSREIADVIKELVASDAD
jgi:hypothetical protein